MYIDCQCNWAVDSSGTYQGAYMQVNFVDQWSASVTGEVDADNCGEFADRLKAGEQSGGTLTVDLSEMGFIDSSGISALLQVKKELESREASLKLVKPTDSVRRILEITGLLATFGLAD